MDQSELPVHLLRYEDLRRAALLQPALDAARLQRAVAFSDFSELQRQEQAHGFRQRLRPVFPARAGWRLAQRLIAVHGVTMRRLGYLDEHGRPT